MNILFYIEPLIQRDNPLMQEPWLDLHVKNIIEGLKDENHNIFIASNSALAKKIENIYYKDRIKKIFSFEQEELKQFSSSSLDILKKWHEKTYSKMEIDSYKKIMLEKFKGIKFDVIISFSPIPYLKEIYSDALFLFCEYGMFSRKPYPKTYHLDPIDFGGYEYLDKYYDSLEKNIEISSDEEQVFLEFLNKLKEISLKNNPFEKEIRNLKNKFEYLVLLPMQASNYWAFDFETEYKSQFEYLEDVLIKTSKFKNIGIIVTQHSSNIFLSDERSVKYLKDKYSNFILLESIRNYSEISPLLVPYVDGIILVSTSIGYHSLLWDKKIITLGKKYLRKLSDSDNLENLNEILKSKTKDRKKILYWLLTYYYILEDYIKNDKWLERFIKQSIKNKNNLELFYEQIDNSKIIFEKFLQECSSISDTISGQYIQIYVNYGNGYFEENSFKFLYNHKIKLDFSDKYIEYILLKFRGIDSITLGEKFYINKNLEIKSFVESENPNRYVVIGEKIFIDELNFLEYNINDVVSKININVLNYELLEKRKLFEKLREVDLELEKLNEENVLLKKDKNYLIDKNEKLLKENIALIEEKNKTLKSRISRKLNEIKTKILRNR